MVGFTFYSVLCSSSFYALGNVPVMIEVSWITGPFPHFHYIISVILMGLRDSVADCRLTATYSLNVVVPEHADFLIEIASSDPVPNVSEVISFSVAFISFLFFRC